MSTPSRSQPTQPTQPRQPTPRPSMHPCLILGAALLGMGAPAIVLAFAVRPGPPSDLAPRPANVAIETAVERVPATPEPPTRRPQRDAAPPASLDSDRSDATVDPVRTIAERAVVTPVAETVQHGDPASAPRPAASIEAMID